MLTTSQSSAFWEQRHADWGDFVSGGDWGMSEADNTAFYFHRLGHLLQIIGPSSDPHAPLDVLDAGCGKGFFSERLAECGHRVVGFDPSATALAHVPKPRLARYRRSAIERFAWDHFFDVVIAVDVLFHILDEAEWERSVRQLASLTRLTGLLVITDHTEDTTMQLGTYIVQRSPQRYSSVLSAFGFALADRIPYAFRGNPNAFHVFRRGET